MYNIGREVEQQVKACDQEQLYPNASTVYCVRYSWTKFGREAEYVVALYLKSVGWHDVKLSPGSRGPADIVATRSTEKWFLQVKASAVAPRLKGREVRGLRQLAKSKGGLAVISTMQPSGPGSFWTGSYAITFHDLDRWMVLDPAISPGSAREKIFESGPDISNAKPSGLDSISNADLTS